MRHVFAATLVLALSVAGVHLCAAQGQPGRGDDAATGGANGPVDAGRVRAAGSSTLSASAAAEIATALLATAPRHADPIEATVGAPLPGDVNVQALPASVADLVPEYRGYHYAAANGEVAIVEPATRRVVEVIRVEASPR